MWATAAIVLLALASGTVGYDIDVVVPPNPAYGSRAVLEANYRLASQEYIDEMKWLKDGVVFMTYNQRPSDEYSWAPIRGVNMNLNQSSPSRVVLEDVGDAASGTYSVEMTVVEESAGTSSVSQFQQSQDMNVGGTDPLGNRFGGARPGSASSFGTTTTFTQQSSQAGSASPGPLGNRFGGAAGAAAAPAAGAAPLPPVGGLEGAIQQLQNAQDRLQAALGALQG